MMGMSEGIKDMFSKMVPSKNHQVMLNQGYVWHEKPQYYTDANGKIIP